MTAPNPYDLRSPEEVWLDYLKADHGEGHPLELDRWGCQFCEAEKELT